MGASNERVTAREVADLLGRLRDLTASGRDADPAERAAFLAEKAELIERIEGDPRQGRPS